LLHNKYLPNYTWVIKIIRNIWIFVTIPGNMIIQSKSSDIFSGIYNITSPSTSVKLVQAHAHTQTEKKKVT